jgi:hypothetical protein
MKTIGLVLLLIPETFYSLGTNYHLSVKSMVTEEQIYTALLELFPTFDPVPADLFAAWVFAQRNCPNPEHPLRSFGAPLYFAHTETSDLGIVKTNYALRSYLVEFDNRGIVILTLQSQVGDFSHWGVNRSAEYAWQCLEYPYNFAQFQTDLDEELSRDPSEPRYVIWECVDHRIDGDYHSEVYDQVYAIGYGVRMIKIYNQMRIARRSCGASRSFSYSYPQKLVDPTLKVGFKRVIHQAVPYSTETEAEAQAEFPLEAEAEEF